MGKKSIVSSSLFQSKDNTRRTMELQPDDYQNAQFFFKRTQFDPQANSIKIKVTSLFQCFNKYIKSMFSLRL